ncbi:CCR4-NOT transcription complex subunit 4 isoform X1 [Phycodurus eques]|uniref:CCR4-NOT transcription complex subunit 4 isoform X1 n=1 Tax=Phycodurus eques TaxID=693459 RepID=UPI002ACDAD7F|nr:CCR4-NOT transcription complex subunit 4 isoform X1 [Phycodurus eques]XP_061534041.1 CCR4-NOT transcription complex subunit 4 isoform X1 [Phycodurus eques]
MSHSPEMKDDPMECPLCMEPLEIDDVNFFPCTCGYQICRFCWHRIRTDENGLCPACRKPYPEDPAVYKPLSQEEIQRIKNEKKQKQNEKKQKVTENRKHLASVRVVQRNLVFVVGLSQRLADPEVLKRPEYFGRFGKIHKVVINNSTSYAGSQGPSASAYVTYVRSEDALRAIQCVNNVVVDGRTLKASLGTTKYCSYFLKSMQCPKPDCMYLHELGDEAASFTKDEMQAGKHQEYEQKLLQDLYKINPSFLQPPVCGTEKSKSKSGLTQRQNSSNGKDGWPTLSGHTKLANGLSEDRKSPPLLDYLDQEGLPSDGLDTDIGPGQCTAMSPFSSNCDSNSSPSDKPSDSIGMVNGDTFQQMPTSDSPSPPPGLTKPSLVVPISVSDPTARSPFEGAAAESQSLFSDNSNFRHPNPLPTGLPPFPTDPRSSDWPMTPEPQSLFTSVAPPVTSMFALAADTIPVSSSTDWQAAFGFGSSSKQQDDDLGFDPFDVTRRALADLIEKELSVQDQSPASLVPLAQGSNHAPGLPPPNGNAANSHHFPGALPRIPQVHHRAIYNSFSFPGSQSSQASQQQQQQQQQQAARHPWMGIPSRNNLTHLNHSASAASHSNFLDLNLPHQHSTGLGGIPISENSSSIEGLNVKEWQDGLRALLPNININFGGLPNSSSSSSSSSSNSVNHIGGPAGISHSLSWDSTASWMDPAIITGIPASAGASLDCLHDDNPPHWLKSLQALTEMDGPASSAAPALQPLHSGILDGHLPLHHRAAAGWGPYLPPATAAPVSQFHSPPPGFQTAFRPQGQPATELLQSATVDRH